MPSKRHPAGTIKGGVNVGGQFKESGLADQAIVSSGTLTLEKPSEQQPSPTPRKGIWSRLGDRFEKASPMAFAWMVAPLFPAATAGIGAGMVGAGMVEQGALLEGASVLQGAAAGSTIGGVLAVLMLVFSTAAHQESKSRIRSKAREALESKGMNTLQSYDATDYATYGDLRRIVEKHDHSNVSQTHAKEHAD